MAVATLSSTSIDVYDETATAAELTPHDLLAVDHNIDLWDERDPSVAELGKLQDRVAANARADDLGRRLESSEEWQSLSHLDRQLKLRVRQETERLRTVLREATRRSTLGPSVDSSSSSPVHTDSAPMDAEKFTSSFLSPPSAVDSAAKDEVMPPSAEQSVEGPSKASACAEGGLVLGSEDSAVRSAPTRKRQRSPVSEKWKLPLWCKHLIEDGYEVVPEHGLGLVPVDVYESMCDSMRHQVKRIWCKQDGRCLLASLVRAMKFSVDRGDEHPSTDVLDTLRSELREAVLSWSDQQFDLCVPVQLRTESREEYVEKYLRSPVAEVNISLLHICRAVHPDAPRIYVISVHKADADDTEDDEDCTLSTASPPHLCSLHVVGDESPTAKTRCVILYHNVALSVRHFEAVAWKKGSRGPSPLKTILQFDDAIICALERWQRRFPELGSQSRMRGARATETTGRVLDLSRDASGGPDSLDQSVQERAKRVRQMRETKKDITHLFHLFGTSFKASLDAAPVDLGSAPVPGSRLQEGDDRHHPMSRALFSSLLSLPTRQELRLNASVVRSSPAERRGGPELLIERQGERTSPLMRRGNRVYRYAGLSRPSFSPPLGLLSGRASQRKIMDGNLRVARSFSAFDYDNGV